MAAKVHRVAVVHWKAGEAPERVSRLRGAGYDAFAVTPSGPEAVREIRSESPAAVVVSLERMPSQGRYLGFALRSYKGTRHIPLVFAGGEAGKVEAVRQLLPDASFTSWEGIRKALRTAIANPPAAPVAPRRSIGHPETPLFRKLGIRAGTVIGLLNPPPDAVLSLGDLPEGAEIVDYLDSRWTLLLWFTRAVDDLERELEWVAAAREEGKIWVFWPKKASGIASKLSPTVIRRSAQRHGLTDYKICSFDGTWSGMALARRRQR